MKRWLLKEIGLYCPTCTKEWRRNEIKPLKLSHGFRTAGGDITEGWLTCSDPKCRRRYPIIEGILTCVESKGPSRYDVWFTKAYLQTHYRGPAQALAGRDTVLEKVIEEHDKVGFYSNPPTKDYYTELANFAASVLSFDSKILDLGCSVGRLTFELGRKARLVIGADPSFEQIQEARSILQTRRSEIHVGLRRVSGDPLAQPTAGHSIDLALDNIVSDASNNVEFIVADHETLPFAPKSFDAVFCASVIDRVEDPQEFINKLDWFVCDNGYLVISSPFDWERSPAPKDRWLGFGAYGTDKGLPEKALSQLLQKNSYRLVREENIPWVTYADCRHYYTWSVYVGLFQAVRPRVHAIDTGEISDDLVKVYQEVFAKSPAYTEEFTSEKARENLSKLDMLFVAQPESLNSPIGFAGGRELTDENSGDDEEAYRTVKHALGAGPVFYIDELAVLKEFEGLGIGTRLLQTLLAKAKASGQHTFLLMTNPDNERAISLYQRVGFRPLYGHEGLITRPVVQRRTWGLEKGDIRLYLCWVDDYARVHLADDRLVYLEFFQLESSSIMGLEVFAEVISRLFGRAFWHSEHVERRWPVDKIVQRLPELALALLAFAVSTKEQIGYALFDRATFGHHKILFVDSMGISPDWQGNGLGTQMLFEGLKRLPSNAVAARTQNPAFVLMLQNLNPEKLLPLTAYYGQEDDLQQLKSLKEKVTELKEIKNFDLRSGLCKEAYSEGKLGDYEIDRRNPKINQIEQRFEELGLNRDRGDAVVVLAEGIKTKGVPQK